MFRTDYKGLHLHQCHNSLCRQLLYPTLAILSMCTWSPVMYACRWASDNPRTGHTDCQDLSAYSCTQEITRIGTVALCILYYDSKLLVLITLTRSVLLGCPKQMLCRSLHDSISPHSMALGTNHRNGLDTSPITSPSTSALMSIGKL